MPLFIIRHAQAGDRQGWCAPDETRPLSERGRRQAEALAIQLADQGISRIVSSPFARCVQTVEPLARATSLMVEVDDVLAEGDRFEPVIALIDRLPDSAVLCSHGDLIPATIDALIRRGMRVDGPADHRKAARWEIERIADSIVSARAIPPPDRVGDRSALV